MFYQEKHPGEKSAHLFQTNKHDLLIISLLLGRHFGSLMAPLGPPPAWVSTALLWLQKNTLLAPAYVPTHAHRVNREQTLLAPGKRLCGWGEEKFSVRTWALLYM